MTDIPGTITTAIREAIQQAVSAERERVKSGLQKIEAQMHRGIDAQLEIAKEALEGAIADRDAAVFAERARFSAELAQIEECMRVANEALLQAKAEQDAAVLAERERCSKAVTDEISKWNCGNGYYANVTEACENIAAKIRFSSPPKVQMDASFSTVPTGNIQRSGGEVEVQHFDIQSGTFVSNKRG